MMELGLFAVSLLGLGVWIWRKRRRSSARARRNKPLRYLTIHARSAP